MDRDFKFYFPDGSEIKSREVFLNFYEEAYFLSVNNISQEREIERILSDGIRPGSHDIRSIMEWKLGGTFKDGAVTARYHTIQIKEIEDIIFRDGFSETIENDPESAVNALSEPKCMGFVYAVTLLHFASKGKYPVYDKFVHIALKIISESNGKFRIITDGEREKEIHTNSQSKRFNEYMNCYVRQINNIFEVEYGRIPSIDRRIDRALWTYGHLFHDSRTNKIRISCWNKNNRET